MVKRSRKKHLPRFATPHNRSIVCNRCVETLWCCVQFGLFRWRAFCQGESIFLQRVRALFREDLKPSLALLQVLGERSIKRHAGVQWHVVDSQGGTALRICFAKRGDLIEVFRSESGRVDRDEFT